MAVMYSPRVLVYFLSHLCIYVNGENDYRSASVVSYTADNFESEIVTKRHFVMFYAPWCGHCKRLSPTWNELANIYNKDLKKTEVIIAKVDCTTETALCAEQDVKSYPTLKYFYGSKNDYVQYRERRDLKILQNFVEEQFNKPEEVPPEAPTPTKGLVELTDETFEKTVENNYVFIMFYTPWSEQSKRLAPTWEKLAVALKLNEKLTIARIDCTINPHSCETYSIQSYPSLVFFKHGEKVAEHNGERNLDELVIFVSVQMAPEPDGGGFVGRIPDTTTDAEPQTQVVELSTDNFEESIADGLVFVKFYAPWCGHCKRLAPLWDDLSKRFIGNNEITIAKVDCTKYPMTCSTYKVDAYPTLVIFRNGVVLDEYSGGRTVQKMFSFVMKHFTRDEL